MYNIIYTALISKLEFPSLWCFQRAHHKTCIRRSFNLHFLLDTPSRRNVLFVTAQQCPSGMPQKCEWSECDMSRINIPLGRDTLGKHNYVRLGSCSFRDWSDLPPRIGWFKILRTCGPVSAASRVLSCMQLWWLAVRLQKFAPIKWWWHVLWDTMRYRDLWTCPNPTVNVFQTGSRRIRRTHICYTVRRKSDGLKQFKHI